MLTQTGAPAFVAPEMQSGSSYTEKIDIWGVGCVLYQALLGNAPFVQTE